MVESIASGRKGPGNGGARVLVPTLRGFDRCVFRGTGYEAQDVLAEIDRVDLLELKPGPHFAFQERLVRNLAWHDPMGLAASCNPGLQRVRLKQDYDLLVLYCQHKHLTELLYVNAIQEWTRRCRKSVCILDEIWANDAYALRHHLKRLQQFDAVVVGLQGSVGAVSEVIGRQCHFVPSAVDVWRFTPLRKPARNRTVDIFSIGRREQGIHRKLLEFAHERDLFYVFDTYGGGDAACPDYRLHREMMANILHHSRCFMVAPALVDMLHHANGQIEVPNRFYEGAAAGAILLGRRPQCEYFDGLFGWPDSVVEIREDGSDAAEVLSALLADPERCRGISQRNAAESLLRHDWVYRWKTIYELVGLDPTPAMKSREIRLREVADSAGYVSDEALPA
ncbi:MAG: glycosyltransferase family 1 protein [Bryobacterales bacterium]|nr:glycosyltransferase family 1 protein [Bryobacterales bacterium]